MPMSAPPFIAARRTRVTLETPQETTNALGGAAIGFTPLITFWGLIETRSGSEKLRGGRLEGASDTRITFRWRAGIDTRMRLSAGTRRFAIRAAFDPDGRKRELVCLCEELTP